MISSSHAKGELWIWQKYPSTARGYVSFISRSGPFRLTYVHIIGIYIVAKYFCNISLYFLGKLNVFVVLTANESKSDTKIYHAFYYYPSMNFDLWPQIKIYDHSKIFWQSLCQYDIRFWISFCFLYRYWDNFVIRVKQ